MGAAWPLVIYQVSAPGSYDAQDSTSVAKAIQSAGRGLMAELRDVQARLEQKKNHRTADFYAPSQATAILSSVARDTRLFKSLLLADALFSDRLANLAKKGRQAATDNPEQALAALTKFSAALVETFHEKLKSLYGGQDFIPFGSLLLLEATASLRNTGQRSPVQAILRAKTRTTTRTLVNKNYIPAPVQTTTTQLESRDAASKTKETGAAAPQDPAPSTQDPAPRTRDLASRTQAPAPETQHPAETPTADPAAEGRELAAVLRVSESDYQRSALALYNQVCRCKLLRLNLDEQTAILDNLLKS